MPSTRHLAILDSLASYSFWLVCFVSCHAAFALFALSYIFSRDNVFLKDLRLSTWRRC